jgi:hypothetical protein
MKFFNFSEVADAGAAAGLSSLYFPFRECSLANTSTEWGPDIGIEAASFVAKKLWPKSTVVFSTEAGLSTTRINGPQVSSARTDET